MRFEHCEPRLALSTTTSALVSPVDADHIDAAALEGGSIAWNLVPTTFSADATTGVQVQFGIANDKVGSLNQTLPLPDLQNRAHGSGEFMLMDADIGQPEILLGDLDAVSDAYSGSPIKPIDPPANGPQHHEGGAIALAPFTSPDSFGRFDRESQLAEHRRAPSKALERGLSARQLPSNEGLRGRAVVFEVAQSGAGESDESLRRDNSQSPADASSVEAVLASNDSTIASEHAAVRAQSGARLLDPTGQSKSDGTRAATRTSEHMLNAGAEQTLAVRATESNRNNTAITEQGEDSPANTVIVNHAARDAALADIEAFELGESDIDAPPPAAAGLRDRTLIGVALALVAGYRPATKLMRGRRIWSSLEQRPPRRRK